MADVYEKLITFASSLCVNTCYISAPEINLTIENGYTVVIAYKNIVGSREKCSYNRYVLITDMFL